MSVVRPLARLAVLAGALIVLLLAGAGLAAAHVTVSSPDAEPGGFGKLTFRVPNESDTASTVRLRIQLPAEAPLAYLSLQPVPGWTATTTEAELEEPIDAFGQEITSHVSVVEFTAAEGGGIRPGEFQEFSLSGGPFPEADTMAFNAIQIYSDGNESAWIEPTVEGGAEPEFPPPVLPLTAAEPAAAPAEAAAAGPVGPAAADHGGHTSPTPAALAVLLSCLALTVALAAVYLAWGRSRRTVAP